MPHCKLEDLPSGGGRWPALGHDGFKTAHWGDMEVGYTTLDSTLDCTESYKFGGLPVGFVRARTMAICSRDASGFATPIQTGPTKSSRQARPISFPQAMS